METFIKWIIGDMGTPGEYMYQGMHIWTVIIVALSAAVLLLLMKRFQGDPKKKRTLIVAVSIFQLAFEILWRLIYLFMRQESAFFWWPTYPCNLAGILVPIIALTRWKRGKQLFYLFAFVGAILTFAMPDGIFCTDVYVFPIVKSVLQHTGILLIPLLEFADGSYRSTLKDMGWVLLGCVLHLINCEGIDRLLGFTDDYMFFRSGMPFVIPGVPQYITLSVFAVLVLTVLSFLCDIPGSVAFLRSFRKKGNHKAAMKE